MLIAWLVVPACQSPAELRAEADREAYDLVRARRERLGFAGEDFTIDPPAVSLRQRILEGEPVASAPLGLTEVLQLSAQNSRDYRERKERLYLSALDLTLERWHLSLQRDASIGADVAGSGGEATGAGAGAGLGFSKLFGSGADVALDLGASLARSLTFSDGWHPASSVGLTITQPLLRGFGERIVLEPLTQAERDLVYEVRAFERYRRTYSVDTATRYWRLLESLNAVQNQQRNFESLQQLTLRNQALAEAGRLSDIEVGQARQDQLRSRNSLISAQARLETQLDDLKVFLGLPATCALELDKGALEELAGQSAGDEIPEELALPFALAHRLDHLTVLDRFEDSKRKLLVAEDQLRSGLELEIHADSSSTSGKPLEYNFRDTTWSGALTWDLPIDRLPERNGYRRAIIDVEAAARDCEESQDTLQADLRDELRSMRTEREAYQIQLNAVELAERRIESTRLKLDAGRADTRDLLEAEDSLLEARNAATSALIDYTLARLAVWRDLEILRVDEGGIHADEEWLRHPDAGGAEAGQEPAGG